MLNKKEREQLARIRPTFEATVEAERLLPILQAADVLTTHDVHDISKLRSAPERAIRLLDLLLLAGGHAVRGDKVFPSLCAALDTTYPQVLVVMQQTDGKSKSEKKLHIKSDDESSTLSRPELLPPSNYSSGLPSMGHSGTLRGTTSATATFIAASPYPPFRPPPPPVSPMTSTMSRIPSLPSSRPPIDNPTDYDWVKTQLDHTQAELRESTKKLEQSKREADMYKQMYTFLKDKVEHGNAEIKSLKSAEFDIQSAKRRLEQEIIVLTTQLTEQRQENDELRQQQREVLSESGSSEVLNKVYNSTVDKYDAVKQELEDVRKRYADQISESTTSMSKLEHLRDEHQQLQQTYKDTLKDLNMARFESKDFQQQCTSAIKKWDKAIRDKNAMEQELHKTRKNLDDCKKDLQTLSHRHQEHRRAEDQLRSERDRMIVEYNLVMSERTSVHKEIDQLQEQLSASEKQKKKFAEEKKAISMDFELLKGEVKAREAERDQAMKSVAELRMQIQHRHAEDFGSSLSTDKDNSSLLLRGSERDSGRSAISMDRRSHLDSYDVHSKSSLDSMPSKEMDALKKEIDAKKKKVPTATLR